MHYLWENNEAGMASTSTEKGGTVQYVWRYHQLEVREKETRQIQGTSAICRGSGCVLAFHVVHGQGQWQPAIYRIHCFLKPFENQKVVF